MVETLAPYAAIISAIAALIGAVSATIAIFRKTRRDRIDELKVEMQVLFSKGWDATRVKTKSGLEEFYQNLSPKFQKPKYKMLHQCAFDELGYEGKNEIFDLLKFLKERYESGRIVTREGGFVE